MERLGLVRDRPGDRLAPGVRPARADLRTDRRGHPGVRRLDLDRPEVPDHRGMDHQAFQTRRPQGPLHRPARRHDRVGPGRAPAAALRSLRPALPRETHRPLRAAAAVHRLDDACPVPSGAARRNLMNIALWIIAGFMATVFLAAGASKLLIPQEKLAKAPGGGWVLDFSAGFVKALGAVEILGAVGLILPALLDIAPVLVPLAALGLGLIMIGAAIVEFRRREFKHVLGNLTYLALLAFVAWGRFGPESFH